MNIGKLLKVAVTVAKANPTLVAGAIGAVSPLIKAIKAEAKKPKA